MWAWREWLATGSRGGETLEVADAKKGLTAGQLREASKLVKRGKAASDLAIAPLAVALSRRRQRRGSGPVELVVLLLIPLAATWLLVERLKQSSLGAAGIFFALAVIWGSWTAWSGWRAQRNAPRAELANMHLLEAAGESYQPHPSRARAKIPSTQRAVSVLFDLVLYDVSYGAIALAVDGRTLSIVHVLERGSLFAFLMTAGSVIFHQDEGRESRPRPLTAGERELMDRRMGDGAAAPPYRRRSLPGR